MPEAEIVAPDGATVGDLPRLLGAKFPALREILSISRLARNETYAEPSEPLAEGDRIAVIPPVSGGREDETASIPGATSPPDFFARIVDEPLDISAIAGRVARPEAGALVLFVGLVRNETAGEAVGALVYEAHRKMAEKELGAILEAARARHALVSGGIIHRVGRLGPTEPSVVIATVAPHREAAYAANREILEEIKKLAPIWKKEERASGAVWVEGGG